MKCIKPILLKNGQQVRCGSCINCRIERSTQWKTRLLYELDNWNCACFVTLTYNTQGLLNLLSCKYYNYPVNSLCKKEVQLFFKRLRKNLKGRKIRYYVVGEYGTKSKRAHYHAIIFGVDNLNDDDCKAIADAWLPRCDDWQFLRERGKKCAIQPVCPEDIEYVTGYVQKKLTGDYARREYQGRLPPFALMSQGLGLDFALKKKVY